MRLFLYAFNSLLALLLTLIALAAVVVVVGDAALEMWGDGRSLLAILAVIGFPLTFVIWPWTHEVLGGLPLWSVFIAGVVSFKLASHWAERAGPDARAKLEHRDEAEVIWEDTLAEMQLGIYRDTTRRFRGLMVQKDIEPVVPDEVQRILDQLVNTFMGPDGGDAVPGSRASLRALGLAGYLWRVAEQGNTGFLDERIRSVIAEVSDEADSREGVIALAASELPMSVSLGYGSPGGLEEGGDFLDAGFDYARRYYSDADTVRDEHAVSAFYFGVALHDVERVLRQA